jgi:hypothetical protein
MAPREILLHVAGGTRLMEVRHEMRRGLSVSRYRLTTPGKATACEFTTLRKARAAFRAQVDGARPCLPGGTEGA